MLVLIVNQNLMLSRLILLVTGLFFALIATIAAYQFMLPVLAGGILSLFLYSPSQRLHQFSRLPLTLCITIIILCFCTASTGLIIIVGALFWNDIVRLVEQIPALFKMLADAVQNSFYQLLPLITKIENWTHSKGLIPDYTTDSLLRSLEKQFTELIQKAGEVLFIELSLFLSTLPGMLFETVITLLSSFFFIKERERLTLKIKALLSSSFRSHVKKVAAAIRFYTWSYVQAQMLLTAITAVIVLSGLLILKIDGAPAIALAAALLDLIPLIGTSALFLPWIFYCWINELNSLMIGLIIIQSLLVASRQILEPKIIGQTLGIHPFITFLLIYLSFQSFGFMGIIFSPLILLLISTFIKSGTASLIKEYIKNGTVLK
ncbi:sporulation integral membrane protein YtvI [Jeotgalibacillus proteolyticus]|uniref:Sporulation integral membrane protein YtvI n=1 Tax=Jeotgalibacillus proteolyticus TaxID=2082395 RepID=A0A2S5GF61_9BACL|nr:sporulation integral membrane protein YtvI [Jeotgalibacillus proteolyticus]PPA71619.1 sporulation integral membrane protein YtvI [Jeotgalibacillus proteolyticus]